MPIINGEIKTEEAQEMEDIKAEAEAKTETEPEAKSQISKD